MKKWIIDYEDEAKEDFDNLDGSQRGYVFKAIEKVSQNPLPQSEGGYGKPLGNKNGNDLTGLFKIKLKRLGLRVLYRLVREHGIMKIVIISVRSDNEVYEQAAKRIQKNK
ncbi:MAG: type II toxin-antitoxin system RelE/ParE family toxin [Treponema sp.]|nr:type II toxin-antitoxin system RelE/ParE family toxin [Treponema sp.]